MKKREKSEEPQTQNSDLKFHVKFKNFDVLKDTRETSFQYKRIINKTNYEEDKKNTSKNFKKKLITPQNKINFNIKFPELYNDQQKILNKIGFNLNNNNKYFFLNILIKKHEDELKINKKSENMVQNNNSLNSPRKYQNNYLRKIHRNKKEKSPKKLEINVENYKRSKTPLKVTGKNFEEKFKSHKKNNLSTIK